MKRRYYIRLYKILRGVNDEVEEIVKEAKRLLRRS